MFRFEFLNFSLCIAFLLFKKIFFQLGKYVALYFFLNCFTKWQSLETRLLKLRNFSIKCLKFKYFRGFFFWKNITLQTVNIIVTQKWFPDLGCENSVSQNFLFITKWRSRGKKTCTAWTDLYINDQNEINNLEGLKCLSENVVTAYNPASFSQTK